MCSHTLYAIGMTMGYALPTYEGSTRNTASQIRYNPHTQRSYELPGLERPVYGSIRSYIQEEVSGSITERIFQDEAQREYTDRDGGYANGRERKQYTPERYQVPNTVIRGGAIRELTPAVQTRKGAKQTPLSPIEYDMPIYELFRNTNPREEYGERNAERGTKETPSETQSEDIKELGVIEQKRDLARLIRKELALFHIKENDKIQRNIIYN